MYILLLTATSLKRYFVSLKLMLKISKLCLNTDKTSSLEIFQKHFLQMAKCKTHSIQKHLYFTRYVCILFGITTKNWSNIIPAVPHWQECELCLNHITESNAFTGFNKSLNHSHSPRPHKNEWTHNQGESLQSTKTTQDYTWVHMCTE